MGPIGPPTSPKHADRPRLLQSSVFYTHGCCYSGRSLFCMGQGYPGKPELSVAHIADCHKVVFFMTFGAKVLEIFVLMIRQFHRNESSWNVRSRGTKVKFHGSESSLYGLFAPGNESAEEQKGLESRATTIWYWHSNYQIRDTHYPLSNLDTARSYIIV